MKIDSEDRFWVVLDPTPESTPVDILWETNLDGLARYLAGANLSGERPSHRHLTIYGDADEARDEASERLAGRDAR